MKKREDSEKNNNKKNKKKGKDASINQRKAIKNRW